ncbi:retrovirus-related Pol polyprotein from transposon 412 [Trichonephila clavipes]|nr:retrovirus-related Pol polyprotein from transposon 412 [Trichonephila clavipes]
MKTRYDTKATGHQFKEGDKVWFYNPTRRKGLSPKLQSHWDGPYTILKIINDVVIRIRPDLNPRGGMGTRKCIVPSQYSRRDVKLLTRLMEGKKGERPLTTPRVFSRKIGVEPSQIVLSPVRCSKLRKTT